MRPWANISADFRTNNLWWIFYHYITDYTHGTGGGFSCPTLYLAQHISANFQRTKLNVCSTWNAENCQIIVFFLLNTVQILVYLYSLAGLGLQYLNLYRSVWWLPHRCSTATSHLTWYSEVSWTSDLEVFEFWGSTVVWGRKSFTRSGIVYFLDPDWELVDLFPPKIEKSALKALSFVFSF